MIDVLLEMTKQACNRLRIISVKRQKNQQILDQPTQIREIRRTLCHHQWSAGRHNCPVYHFGSRRSSPRSMSGPPSVPSRTGGRRSAGNRGRHVAQDKQFATRAPCRRRGNPKQATDIVAATMATSARQPKLRHLELRTSTPAIQRRHTTIQSRPSTATKGRRRRGPATPLLESGRGVHWND